MSEVLETMPLQPAGRKRKNRVLAIKSLDGRLFIDTEHDSVLRRIQVKADHIRSFGLELRVVRGHVALHPMRFDSSPGPRLGDNLVAHSQFFGQLAGAPVGRAVARLLSRLGQNSSLQRRGQDGGLSALLSALETGQSLALIAFLPSAYVGGTAPQKHLNFEVGFSFSQ